MVVLHSNTYGAQISGLMASINVIVPRYIARLDQVASTLVSQVNNLQSSGSGLDGLSGRNFFDPAGVTAATIGISTDVSTNPAAVAARATGQGALDGSNAQAIAALSTATTGAD